MKLEHSFTVPADLDTVWQAVLDPELVAPCMPGATLTEVEGDTFKGSVKVKLGPISLLYKGSGEFLSQDPDNHTLVMKASGKDARGNGTAAATVTVALAADGASTVGTVETNLSITGKPAQFGRGLISEVGGKILDTFAERLSTELARPQEAPALSVVRSEETTEPTASSGAASAADRSEAVAIGRNAGETAAATISTIPRRNPTPDTDTEPIDLLSYATPSILKRAAPLLVLAAAIVAFVALRRRR